MIMTPLVKVCKVAVNSTKSDLLELCKKYPHTRYPVYEGWGGNIIGLVDIYECLTAENDFTNLYNMVRPICRIPSDMTVMDAIDIMQKEKEKMILIIRGKQAQRPVGIVTMKDLVEELFGELVEW